MNTLVKNAAVIEMDIIEKNIVSEVMDKTMHTNIAGYKNSFSRKLDEMAMARVNDLVAGHFYDSKKGVPPDPTKEERIKFLMGTESIPMAVGYASNIRILNEAINTLSEKVVMCEIESMLKEYKLSENSFLNSYTHFHNILECIKLHLELDGFLEDNENIIAGLKEDLIFQVKEITDDFTKGAVSLDLESMPEFNNYDDLIKIIKYRIQLTQLQSIELSILEAALLGTAVSKLLTGVPLSESEIVMLQSDERLENLVPLLKHNGEKQCA